jgi:hypothetical protein
MERTFITKYKRKNKHQKLKYFNSNTFITVIKSNALHLSYTDAHLNFTATL